MIFSQADFDLLRLLRWNRHLLPETIDGLFTERDIQNLIALGLIKIPQRSGSFVLTSKGNQLLNDTLSIAAPDTPPSYRPVEMQRRLRLSMLAVTAYRAHIHIFTTGPEELSSSPSLFLTAVSRGRGHNPWGNTRIAALAHLGGLLLDVQYVCVGIGKLCLADELTVFNNQAARFRELQRAFLFAGERYADVLAELTDGDLSQDNKFVHYAAAYRSLRLPVHLLSCDSVGAMQLQIMSEPDYRTRLTQAALRSYYQPPPADAPDWDAMYGGMPFVLAADMNLRRIDAAIQTARERGYRQVAMAALKEQGEALLIPHYRGLVQFYALTDNAVSELLGRPATLHTPKRTQFQTSKGDVVDAPLIKAAGKTGRPSGGSLGPMV